MTLAPTCCVVGGGPAGVMLGYLLARQGVPVVVLEKHPDFFRDFRGDTVHPSTLEIFHELGLLEEFLKLPHQELQAVHAVYGDYEFKAADFRYVPAHCRFVALMPQWDFLGFLSREAKRFPNFELLMQHEATGVITEAGRVTGVEVRTPDGMVRIEADLVVACDGRHSTIRESAGMEVLEFGVPIDVLWFRISRHENDPEEVLGTVNYGRALILINRGSYFQAGFIVEKGSFEAIRNAGLEAFRESIRKVVPFLGGRVEEIQGWDQVKLLTVQINRLRKWHKPGLLLTGDAAHAMSPAGGVGINLAIQDAVAAARMIGAPLKEKRLTEKHLALVQQRREFPTKVTQFLQLNAHRGFAVVFRSPGPLRAPWQLKLVTSIPVVCHIMGRVVGIGARPEHVSRPAAVSARFRRVAAGVALAAIATGMLLMRKKRASN